MSVTWTDWFNVPHKIDFASDHAAGEIHVWFPNVAPVWNWRDEGWQRTGFNEACKWIYASFRPQPGNMFRDDSVRIDASCYKFKGEPMGSTLMDEVKKGFSDTAEISKSVETIVQSGVSSTTQVLEVAAKIEAATAAVAANEVGFDII